VKNILLALCTVFMLSLNAVAAPAPIASDSSAKPAAEVAAILELERQWYAMRIARDVTAIDNLLSDDFAMTGSYGKVRTKAQLLEQYRSAAPSFKLKAFQTGDVNVRIYRDAAVVTGFASVDGDATDGRVVSAVRFTRTYVRIDGRWRLVAQQMTRIIR
jgi:ketosteroid isomerase-like protein